MFGGRTKPPESKRLHFLLGEEQVSRRSISFDFLANCKVLSFGFVELILNYVSV